MSEDEPESWSRVVKLYGIEWWRMKGRPFDPHQRATSRGEQQQHAADTLLWTVSGVLGAAGALWLAWSVLIAP